jgi:hypothetical protein
MGSITSMQGVVYAHARVLTVDGEAEKEKARMLYLIRGEREPVGLEIVSEDMYRTS